MTQQSEIEEIARAIFDDDVQWAKFPPEYREPILRQARAAYEVMARSDRDAAIREAAEWVWHNVAFSGRSLALAMLEELGVTDKVGALLQHKGTAP